ncbi:hypothetical protein KTT_04680 [Tengunoibacter tsumagoiensis]|uniref:HTH gntR-type domain-containing protein n=2 Tax=Tengunoibacter tsumagoiensis TaxID=2014871 RepID=A0A401ZUL7_9CHLR|nr:hypothetical protein KTT_04680 [Tengunoibacter tsumagoiensis]
MYRQVEQDIRNKIQMGEWPAGSMLPGRANLAKIYGVSMPTLEQAIGLLISDGTLRAEPKRGTFVSQPVVPAAVPAQVSSSSFTRSRRSITAPTLGILAQKPFIAFTSGVPVPANGFEPDQWNYVLMQSLQRSFAQVGGRVHLVQELAPTSEHTTMKEAITLLLDHGIDAIVISIFDARFMSEVVRALFDIERVPVALVSWEEIISPCPVVCFDNLTSGYRAGLHLLRVGYAPVYHFLQCDDRSWVSKRIEGVKQAMQDFGVSPEQLRIHSTMKMPSGQTSEEATYQASQELIAQGILETGSQGRPVGIIAQNDEAAAGFLRAAQRSGKVAGKDFGLIGFDNHPLAAELGITSIRPPIEALGEEVIRLLWRQLHERQISQQRSLLSGNLIVRSSTSRGMRA